MISLDAVTKRYGPGELAVDALAFLGRLPPLCRRVFVLRKVYRLSHDEISEVLGVSHSTIEKHVAKGLIRCRDYLRDVGLIDAIESKDRAEMPRPLRDLGDGE